jgi:hypothetical protein
MAFMKINTVQKQVLTLASASLVTAALIIYVIASLLSGDRSGEQVNKLSVSLNTYLESASQNFARKKAGETIDQEKDIIAPLIASHKLLTNVYGGQPTEVGKFEKPDSESEKEIVKLAIVSIEKLQEDIKSGSDKAEAQFEPVKASSSAVTAHYLTKSKNSVQWLKSLAWIAVALTGIFFIGLVTLAAGKLNSLNKITEAAKNKVKEEEQRVDQLSKFIEGVASGNFEMQIETSKNDELSSTLVAMRDKLRNNAVEEQRRNWSTTGLAKIGEILRSTGNSAELYDSIIKFLVKYTNSNQGGLFILDDSDSLNQSLDLIACYAFERKKFLIKKVEIGQGLVGQCFLEKEKIHLTEIPDDYVRITSGLGGDRPTSCLLVPLKVNDKVFGVVELASFQIYADHVVELVEKFAESIASTIANVKTNESTRVLLEQTQQQAEEMKSQEEEMRQNMEELSATQEEMHRKEQEYINRIKELEVQVRVGEKV